MLLMGQMFIYKVSQVPSKIVAYNCVTTALNANPKAGANAYILDNKPITIRY